MRELPELARQAYDYAVASVKAEELVDYLAIDGRDHFSILEELASPTGALTKTLIRSLGASW